MPSVVGDALAPVEAVGSSFAEGIRPSSLGNNRSQSSYLRFVCSCFLLVVDPVWTEIGNIVGITVSATAATKAASIIKDVGEREQGVGFPVLLRGFFLVEMAFYDRVDLPSESANLQERGSMNCGPILETANSYQDWPASHVCSTSSSRFCMRSTYHDVVLLRKNSVGSSVSVSPRLFFWVGRKRRACPKRYLMCPRPAHLGNSILKIFSKESCHDRTYIRRLTFSTNRFVGSLSSTTLFHTTYFSAASSALPNYLWPNTERLQSVELCGNRK